MGEVCSFEIEGEMAGCNEYIDACRASKYAGHKIKKEETERVAWAVKAAKIPKLKLPIYLTFDWVCKNKRRDKDNIAFAKKFILDGMVMAGVIERDTWAFIEGWADRFYIDKEKPMVRISTLDG